MVNRVKKGTKGPSAAYLTRAAALKKLQLSLADFRRLCILKGVYPREPKKKLKGADKTYYHSKDIIFLAHEPLLNKFRDLKVALRRYKKAVCRREPSIARKVLQNKPLVTFHHLVKERCPTLTDALRDLDDALSSLSLFASLPTNDSRQIDAVCISESLRLVDEFHLFVSQSNSLQKVFVSIKGYYFQAKVLGETITWLVPHQFTQLLPSEVDFKVMITFLEYYRTLVKFTNYKLYELWNFSYPPTSSTCIMSHSLSVGSRYLSLSTKSLNPAKNAEVDDEASNCDPEEVNEMETKRPLLFSNLTFFVSREVSKPPLVFMIRSFGGSVGWEQESSPIDACDPSITHHIIDRPEFQKVEGVSREYVQPQWVFDCINSAVLLPVDSYGPGCALPPHLSPFVDDTAEGYIPQQREVLNAAILDKRPETVSAAEADEESDTSDVEELKEKEQLFHQKMNKEIPETENLSEKKLKRKEAKATEETERRKALLSKKHKRLLQRIEFGQNTKADAVEKLKKRRETAR